MYSVDMTYNVIYVNWREQCRINYNSKIVMEDNYNYDVINAKHISILHYRYRWCMV